jgi:hypothetical protein
MNNAKSKKKEIEFLAPKSLANIGKILKDNSNFLNSLPHRIKDINPSNQYIDDRYIGVHKDKYLYTIHIIIEFKLFNIVDIEKWALFSPINIEVYQSLVGKDYYRDILNDLIALNIIICDNQYIVGEKSRGYALTKDYAEESFLKIGCTNDILCKKLQQHYMFFADGKTKSSKLVAKDLKKIRIRFKDAVSYLNRIYTNSLNHIDTLPDEIEDINDAINLYNSKINKEFTYSLKAVKAKSLPYVKSFMLQQNMNIKDYLHHLLVLKYKSDYRSIEKIDKGEWFLIHEKNIHTRIYTNITNLNKRLKQFLYHKDIPNEPLYSIDLKNSQPFLLNIIIREYYNFTLQADAIRYRTLTSNGTFYYHEMSKHTASNVDKDEFKKIFFKNVFYCKSIYSARTSEGKAFRSEFPSVYKVIEELKSKDYKNLAITLQFNEAKIFLGQIIPALKKNKIWVTTVHDSVIVKQQDVELTQQIISNIFKNEYDLYPTLSCDELTGKKEHQAIEAAINLSSGTPNMTIPKTEQKDSDHKSPQLNKATHKQNGIETIDELLYGITTRDLPADLLQIVNYEAVYNSKLKKEIIKHQDSEEPKVSKAYDYSYSEEEAKKGFELLKMLEDWLNDY